jgi:hypothetical protein
MEPFDPRLTVIAAEAKVRTCHVFHCIAAMRAMGEQFHAGAFAQFAGLELRHVERIMQALEGHQIRTKRVTAERGSRLPADFALPKDWRDWAVSKRKWEPDAAGEEGEAFAAYWQAKSGKDAVKMDWFKTWQNWVRNSRRPDGSYVTTEQRQTPEGWLAYCEERLQWAKDKNYREGIALWTIKLLASRDKVHQADNVLPFGRAC